MYEARQNKEKVSRRIDAIGGGARQKVNLGANKINSIQTYSTPWIYGGSKYSIQRKLYGNPSNAKDLIEKQIELQAGSNNQPAKISEKLKTEQQSHQDPNSFTTVGYEFEFIQLKDEGNGSILQNAIHVELGKSNEKFEYTGLPFSLETDSSGTIELVTPPFIIDTYNKTSIPVAKDLLDSSNLMENALDDIVKQSLVLETMVNHLKTNLGITFSSLNAKITDDNLIGDISSNLSGKKTEQSDVINLDMEDLKDLELQKSKKLDSIPGTDKKVKGHLQKGIATQINIAMTTEDYLKMSDMPSPLSDENPDKQKIQEYRDNIFNHLSLDEYPDVFSPIIKEVSVYLANTCALEAMDAYREESKKYFNGEYVEEKDRGHLESSVKDFRGLWFKDSIKSMLVDFFSESLLDSETMAYKELLILRLKDMKTSEFTPIICDAAKDLATFISNLDEGIYNVPNPRPKLCKRKRKGLNMYDARPDTYVASNLLTAAPGLGGKHLHLIESRYQTPEEIVAKIRTVMNDPEPKSEPEPKLKKKKKPHKKKK